MVRCINFIRFIIDLNYFSLTIYSCLLTSFNLQSFYLGVRAMRYDYWLNYSIWM